MSAQAKFLEDVIEYLNREQAHGTCCVYLASKVREQLFAPGVHQKAELAAATKTESVASDLAKQQVQATTAASVRSSVSPSTEGQVAGVQQVLEVATGESLEDLRCAVEACSECQLCRGRRNVVFGEGDPDADLMFIGEGPGADEERVGQPFVGRAGELLTKMIQAMQFTRDQVYLASVIKCRPPGNRNPKIDEASACLPYLNRQIQLVKPKVLVLLGGVPLQHLLGLQSIMKHRGVWQTYMGIPTMPTYHPAFLLRSPSRKADVWHDLQQVMKKVGKNPEETMRKMQKQRGS